MSSRSLPKVTAPHEDGFNASDGFVEVASHRFLTNERGPRQVMGRQTRRLEVIAGR
ncbi:hypothetical protein Saso_08440 [Streptomyces asoensis]|uniref:Uncharacterized protein n=1 Tax=Streptomyces asoensis TaxID=249586 RepID=A0ABQ3RTI9_9ACTN|nr:hypothetical protein GCM10010496_71410 [Streptomyces asoensis]GHI59194.1 hypothetical protein Saso_08440 [Streptomyces asoensis]